MLVCGPALCRVPIHCTPGADMFDMSGSILSYNAVGTYSYFASFSEQQQQLSLSCRAGGTNSSLAPFSSQPTAATLDVAGLAPRAGVALEVWLGAEHGRTNTTGRP